MNILISLLGFFIFSQLGYHFWPEWSIVNGIRIDYLSPTLYCFDLIFILILIFGGFRPVIQKHRFVICLFVTLNLFFSLSPLNSTLRWLRLFECFWLFSFFNRNPHYLKNLLIGFFAGTIMVSILALGQFIKGSSLGGFWYWVGERTFSLSTPGISKIYLEFGAWDFGLALRPYATFPHPNVLAGVLFLVSILFFQSKKRIFIIAGFISWIIIFFTFSRVIIFFQIIILFFLSMKLRRPLFLAIIPLFFLLFLTHPNSISDRVINVKSFFSNYSFEKIFGLGLGNSFLFQSQPVHNIFLLAISELGLFSFLFMFGCFTEKIKIRLRLDNFFKIIFLLTVLASGMIDHYWWTLPQAQIALSICLPFALKLGGEPNKNIY